MKHYKKSEMKWGYIAGNFSPSAMQTSHVEIAVKTLEKHMPDAGYFRKIDTEMIYVISGKLKIGEDVYESGDILVFAPYELINLFALETSELLVVKFPGTKGDIYPQFMNSYEAMDAFYRSCLHTLMKQNPGGHVIPIRKTVNPKEVSVVVQGYVDPKLTPYTTASVRKYLPGARLILSTWKECDCSNMDYDELIQNEDPGNCDCALWADGGIGNNGNRQILSTKAGLSAVETPYVLKLRSDLLLLGNHFLDYLYSYPERKTEYQLFDNRLLIGELFTRNSYVYKYEGKNYEVPKPFHPSDWFVFGRTEDIHRLYDPVDLIPEYEMSGYICKYPERARENKYTYSWRYTTEQHLFLGAVKKYFPDIQFEDWTDWTEENISASRNLILNNFIILNFLQHNILNLKYAAVSFTNSGVSYREKNLMDSEEFREYYNEEFKAGQVQKKTGGTA